MDQVANLHGKLAEFSDHWSPRTIASFNGHDIMVVKVDGPFVWHSHPDTDDFFLVLEGQLDIEMRHGTAHLNAGEVFIVPRGIEHRPVARNGEAKILLIEPSGTPNTGDETTAAPRIFA